MALQRRRGESSISVDDRYRAEIAWHDLPEHYGAMGHHLWGAAFPRRLSWVDCLGGSRWAPRLLAPS
ncbi:hypothetical protein [Glutamicibacter sp.]|uniref:hypothetical protein n=1 Tax=Glutamicibacter sp. TaxID=1931995 RepID=UPI002FDAE209